MAVDTKGSIDRILIGGLTNQSGTVACFKAKADNFTGENIKADKDTKEKAKKLAAGKANENREIYIKMKSPVLEEIIKRALIDR